MILNYTYKLPSCSSIFPQLYLLQHVFPAFFFPVTSATLQARPPEITSDCTSTPSHPGTSARSANLKLISWSSRGRDSRGSWSKSVYIIIWNVYIKAIYIHIYHMYVSNYYIYIYTNWTYTENIWWICVYIYLTQFSSLQKRMKISHMTQLNRSFGRFGFHALKSWLWPWTCRLKGRGFNIWKKDVNLCFFIFYWDPNKTI